MRLGLLSFPRGYRAEAGKLADICGGNAEENADDKRGLERETGPCRDVVLMNAAAALFVGKGGDAA